MEKREMLYEGKAKKVYRTDDPDMYVVEYKDDATAFNGLKKGTIDDKGALNNRISGFFFRLLEDAGVKTHFVSLISDNGMLVKTLEILQVEVVVRNVAAGSLSKRLGYPEGTVLPQTVVEFYYKNDDLGDPLINNYHAKVLGIADDGQLKTLETEALRVNDILRGYLAARSLDLIDFKLEFGLHKGEIVLGDEISPDTCRFWDTTTKEKLDKDRFRRDMGGVEEAYREIARRLGV